MDYKIIRANASIGQIEVEYSQAGKVCGVYAIDVPIVDGAFLTGEELDASIRLQAPTWVIQREQELATATGFEQIEALVETPTQEQIEFQENSAMWAQVAFEQQVAKALVKFGLLESDPTQVEVSQL